MSNRLFEPLQVGPVIVNHRMEMAPLTRFRADDNHRATFISKAAGGYPNVPGIWNQEQITAWRKVTDAVHAKGGFIYCRLWALGRVVIPEVAAAEVIDIVSSSPSALELGALAPREATKDEIQSCVRQYAQAARNAVEAGFDGVEIHGSGGYLVDQFTQDNCNQRTDEYGGSIENRARFILEVTCAMMDAIGANRVGVKLSTWLGYLHLIEARICGNVDSHDTDSLDFAIEAWGNAGSIILAGGGYTPTSAKKVVDEKLKDKDIMVAFGRHFISDPDLPLRVKEGLELEPYDRSTFYTAKSVEGYLDYPFSTQFESQGLKGL
ncbi:related to NADPH2 dehydrogenase chain OYE2 [Cephalotrichum gorgonifer]|uniref:Related to NADPH2 dehydrogenase chain OYE2 n=1 Tax=Cephalotrichum gorgonifer TaxID=2041049 RepID=A0AAE8N6L4_9PEZI|nr:related to NADPH2 dehydrogenase chain OYE2 [Cephalotrichum gorgonifer]